MLRCNTYGTIPLMRTTMAYQMFDTARIVAARSASIPMVDRFRHSSLRVRFIAMNLL